MVRYQVSTHNRDPDSVKAQYAKKFETHRTRLVRYISEHSSPHTLKTQEMTGMGTCFYLLFFVVHVSSNIAHTAQSTKPTRHKRRLFAHVRPPFIYKNGVYMPPPPEPLPPNPPRVPPAGPFTSKRTDGYDPTYYIMVG